MKVIYLKNRFISLIVFVCVVFTIFLSRLVNWQIFNSAYYKMKAAQSHSYIMKTDPIRGEILDRFGIGLATNSVGYKLVLDDFNLTKGREAECINKILDLMRYLKIDWNPTSSYQRDYPLKIGGNIIPSLKDIELRKHNILYNNSIPNYQTEVSDKYKNPGKIINSNQTISNNDLQKNHFSFGNDNNPW